MSAKNCFWSPTGDYLCYKPQRYVGGDKHGEKTSITHNVTRTDKEGKAGTPFLTYSSPNRAFGNANPFPSEVLSGATSRRYSDAKFWSPSAYWQNNQNFDLILPLGTYPRFLPENKQNPYLYFPNTLGIRNPRDNCFTHSNY